MYNTKSSDYKFWSDEPMQLFNALSTCQTIKSYFVEELFNMIVSKSNSAVFYHIAVDTNL